MPHVRPPSALAAVLALPLALGLPLLPGCGERAPAKPAAAPASGAHDEKPPHGGEMLELGDHEIHLEVLHDHDGGNIGVYVYGDALTKPLHVARPVVMTQDAAGPVEVTLTPVDARPDGSAHHWKGQHKALIADPWLGTIRLVVNGKSYQSPLEGEGHAHDPK